MKYKGNLYSLRKRPVKLAKSSLSYLFLLYRVDDYTVMVSYMYSLYMNQVSEMLY
jgi:hypothetical protein